MVSASSAVRKSMPRISAPICLDNGTTSTLAAIATFMFILDGIWQLRRAYLRKMLHCGSLPINYSAKWQVFLRPRRGIPGCSQAFEPTKTTAVGVVSWPLGLRENLASLIGTRFAAGGWGKPAAVA